MQQAQLRISSDLEKIGRIKFEILASGLNVSERACALVSSAKGPIRTRSGASGGLDIILPNDVYVNSPINEAFASRSELRLDLDDDDSLVIAHGEEILCGARLQPVPEYYGQKTSDNIPMVKIGQLCSGDRFCYGMTGPYCVFWRAEDRCRFCSIGLNKDHDASQKTVSQVLEVLAVAMRDPLMPVKHVLIGGGTPNVQDAGAFMAAELCSAIKKEFAISCYVMIATPASNSFIDAIWEAGADELGLNLEFQSENAWREFIPGKYRYIGKKRYLEALEHAVARFGPINTRSILIVGLESPEATLQGVDELAAMGVMPILSPFRSLDGTMLESRHGFDGRMYYDIFAEAHLRAMRFGIPTGPTCIPCQNNTLALPIPGGAYRFY